MRDTSVELIEQVIHLIEARLNEPLLLDTIAGSMYISKFHLVRLFKALTGQTLMAYVRGRRLSRSIGDLLDTDETLCYIAALYGFYYEQSYERAFKCQFGLSPTSFRSNPRELEIVHKLDTSAIHDFANGIFTSPRFVMLPEMMFAGIKHRIPLVPKKSMAANEAALYFCNTEREAIAGRKNEHLYYGFSLDVNSESYTYMPCVEIAAPLQNQPPFDCFSLPSQLYAVFKYVGFHSTDLLSDYTLNDIYDYITLNWLEKSACQRDGDYMIERVDATVCTSTYCEADIFLPVKV